MLHCPREAGVIAHACNLSLYQASYSYIARLTLQKPITPLINTMGDV